MTAQDYKTSVAADWVDYNGHMRDGFYMVVFSSAIDQMMDEVGLDAAYREATKGTLYTVEAHVCFLKEAHVGEALQITNRVLDHDAKRIHLFQSMLSSSGALLATQESMLLHIDQSGDPRAAPFPPAIAAAIRARQAAGADQERPAQAGRAIAIRRSAS